MSGSDRPDGHPAGPGAPASPDVDALVRLRTPPTSLRASLRSLVWGIVLPAAVTAMVATVVGWKREQVAFERAMQSTARALAVDVDRALGTLEGVAWALSGSDALVERDLSAFHRLASGASHPVGAWAVVVEHPEKSGASRQVLNTRVPIGTPLPLGRGLGQFDGWKDRTVVVSDLFVGPVGGGWVSAVTVPSVRMRDASRLSVSVATGPERFQELVAAQRFPEDWTAGVLDRGGRVVARIPASPSRIGQPATSEVLARVKSGVEGAFPHTTFEGRRATVYLGRSPTYGWWFAIAVPDTVRYATIARSALVPAGVAILALGVALFAYRRIAGRAIRGLDALAATADGAGVDARARWVDVGLSDVDRIGRHIAGNASRGSPPAR